MKKLLLLLIITISFCLSSLSQTRSGLGIHFGFAKVGTYQLSDNEDNYSFEHKNANGLQLGIRYNLKVGPLGFSPELNIVNFKFNYTDETPDNSRYYIALPMLVKWYVGPINLHVGPRFSYLVGGRWDSSQCVLDQCTAVTKGDVAEEISLYQKTDFSAVFGIGVDTKIGVYASLRGVFSMTPIMNRELINYYEESVDDFNTNSLEKYLSGQLFIGYKF